MVFFSFILGEKSCLLCLSFLFEAFTAGLFILVLRKFHNLRFRFFAGLFIIFCVFFAANCRNETANTNIKVPEKQKTIEPSREITDGLGRTVRIPEKVTRAVSLAPNLTEIVFAVGAGDELVGVTSFDDYPEEAQKIAKIGDTINPNIENIIALKPQIVLVSTASQIENFTKRLEDQGIAVFVTNPNSLEEIYKSITEIGDIFGAKENALELVENMERRVELVQRETDVLEKPKVFVQISPEPLYTIGKDSFITDLIERAGGISITETVATAYPNISKETALALQPEVIVLSDSPDNTEPNAVFENSPAMKKGKVYKIDSDILSRPGPRIVDGLEQIAKKLHPEISIEKLKKKAKADEK